MKLILRFIRLLIVIAVIILLASGLWGYFILQGALQQPLQVDQPTSLDVASGSTPARVLSQLERDGIIERAQWLRRYWQWQMPNSVLQVGVPA